MAKTCRKNVGEPKKRRPRRFIDDPCAFLKLSAEKTSFGSPPVRQGQAKEDQVANFEDPSSQSQLRWGLEGQGLAPRYRAALRQAMATHLGHRALMDTQVTD